ncbi:signal transduction histidine kinase [Catenulispora sp. GP43]|uniref:sensor histidine kinase n=1 Tax=Catenulispora sp. GP43 TaxID=3156263 RepID=UPI003517B9DD
MTVLRPADVAARFRLLGGSFVLLLGMAAGVGLLALWISVVASAACLVGVPLTVLATVPVRRLADWHRDWAARLLGEPVGRPYTPVPDVGWLERFQVIVRDPASWRDWAWLVANTVLGWFTYGLSAILFLAGVFYLIFPLLYAVTPADVFHTPLGFPIDTLAGSFVLVPLSLVCFLTWYVTAVPLAHAEARLIRRLLAPTGRAELRARVRHLADTRAETVDTQAAELRRIERDLHDGAQARLVSLGMSLGLAESTFADDPHSALRLVAEARESTSTALDELRDLVRGIHPPVLADRGLDGAIQALVLANPVPTSVEIDLPGRLSAPVESAAYFAIAEALANAIKHAQARRIAIAVEFTAGRAVGEGLLRMSVCDDGRGGARIEGGSGLHGVRRRLAAFDGELVVDSPHGGPTEVRMSLPCASS